MISLKIYLQALVAGFSRLFKSFNLASYPQNFSSSATDD
ncbi:MAG: hypothetical protein OFPII_34490 [Osedax symbiont Rs1]|nr:MAG: hypothetical protein OFPII_34490 [Osedax symbiont Rs1]